MRPALALLLALSAATAAPLPFPREVRDPALKVIQGEWEVFMITIENAGLGVTQLPHLSVKVRGDRLSLFHDGEVAFEWTVSTPPIPIKGGQAFRLASPAGVSIRQGAYRPGKDSLTLILVPEDIGRLPASKYSKDAPPRVVLTLWRKAP